MDTTRVNVLCNELVQLGMLFLAKQVQLTFDLGNGTGLEINSVVPLLMWQEFVQLCLLKHISKLLILSWENKLRGFLLMSLGSKLCRDGGKGSNVVIVQVQIWVLDIRNKDFVG